METETGNLTPAILLPLFYSAHDLGDDGGQSQSSVRIEVTDKIHFFIPNFDARRKAVLWHDIHHLVTGYSAGTFLGECEISAWEISSGCRKYWAAFLIDTSGVVLGCFLHPRKIIQAYARGRKTLNLYHDIISKDVAMQMSIADLQHLLHLDHASKETKPTSGDLFRLGLFLVFGSVYSILSILQIPFLIGYNAWFAFRRKPG